MFGDVGISSKVICGYMLTGRPPGRYSYPLDPSDLHRCIKLLNIMPGWKDRLHEMACAGPEWAALIVHWSMLETMLNEELSSGSAPRTYELMQKCIREGEDSK
jgi:hypothetical protein